MKFWKWKNTPAQWLCRLILAEREQGTDNRRSAEKEGDLNHSLHEGIPRDSNQAKQRAAKIATTATLGNRVLSVTIIDLHNIE